VTDPGNTLLIIGGSSDIGHATALAFARSGWNIQLAGRGPASLMRNAKDIEVRTSRTVTVHEFDALDSGPLDQFVDSLPVLPAVAVCVVGLLGDQRRAEVDALHARDIMRSNYEGPALVLDALAARMAQRGSGTLVGVSSVAGDRGRASNYFYGSAKAAFTAYLSGLRNRLYRSGVNVITVKPGFVATRMTAGMKLPPALVATPHEVGAAIFRAVQRGRTTIYVRGIWRWIMAIICSIPERIFRRLSL
jgi:short-subunit dehydrogenase